MLPHRSCQNSEGFAHNKARVGVDGASSQTKRRYTLRGRECYCDELVECSDCSHDVHCGLHDGLFCSTCACWFHAKCIGGVISFKDGVKSMNIHMSSTESLSIQLNGSAETSKPWYCVRCWENAKANKRTDVEFSSFKDVPLIEQALRLGVDVYQNHPDLDVLPSNEKKQCEKKLSCVYKKYAKELSNSIGDCKMAESILSNTPRAFPTPKPMDKGALRKLKFAGRRFEIAQLSLNINTCSCCGCTKPYNDDNWKKNSKITGQTQDGHHLRGQFYEAHK